MPPLVRSRRINQKGLNEVELSLSLDYSSSSSMSRQKKSHSSEDGRRKVESHRTVAFLPFVVVKKIESLDDYSNEDIQALWYSDEEISAMKKVNSQLTRNSKKLTHHDSSSVCLRGLEGHIPPLSKRLHRIKKTSVTAVLLEQQYQQRRTTAAAITTTGSNCNDNHKGMMDPELIKTSYMCVTRRLLNRAYEIAQQDALDAQLIQQEHPMATQLSSKEQQQPTPPSRAPMPVCWIFDPTIWWPKRNSFTCN